LSRRIFLSYQHLDQLKAKGFNLMRYNKGLDLEFVTRGILDPVKSNDPAYISDSIKRRMKGTSVTVVLLGDRTADSSWVAKELEWSVEKAPPNGLVGIRLSPDAETPEGLDGAEILDWSSPDDVQQFGPAIERAARAARRMADATALLGGGSNCGRA
jgi:hypothetical protein